MASLRTRQHGKKNLWYYEIREDDKVLDYKGGFKTKREAELTGGPILQKIELGNRVDRKMSLANLYQQWLDLKILSSNRSQLTIKNYLNRKKLLKNILEIWRLQK